MSGDTEKLLRLLLDVGVSLVILYYTIPGRPPIEPLFWRAVGRASDHAADRLFTLSRYARTRYWGCFG